MVKEINEKLLNDIVNNDFETCINQFIINSQQSTRILFQSNYNNSQAINIIEAEMEATPERDEIMQFIKDSHRGIMKGYYKAN